jgi:hypothetical protein
MAEPKNAGIKSDGVRNILQLSVLLLVFFLGYCCPNRYAAVSLESIDPSGAGVSTYAYAAESNLYLGMTNPLFLHYSRRSCQCTLAVGYFVQDTTRGIPVTYQVFKITRWAPSAKMAMDADYLNRCLFMVHKTP